MDRFVQWTRRWGTGKDESGKSNNNNQRSDSSTDKMNIDKLREELTFDEGLVEKIYLDHLGYPTFGIGHLILETDPEHGQDVDTPVSEDRIKECFEKDIAIVTTELDRNCAWWIHLPEYIQRVLANMGFNLGITRLLKFKKFLAALEQHDWETAAVEMMDSRWATQVGPRATRLRDRVLLGGQG